MKKITILFLSLIMLTQSTVENVYSQEVTEADIVSEITEFSEDELLVNSSIANDLLETGQVNELEKLSQSRTETTLDNQLDYPYKVDYSKLTPSEPNFANPSKPVEVFRYEELKSYLEEKKSTRVKVMNDIDFPTSESAARITIPAGFDKELDLNENTLKAGNKGQFEVQGNYFKMQNGHIIGGYGDDSTRVPAENERNGLVYAPKEVASKALENDIVFENIEHRNSNTSKTGKGGFITVNSSNIFFTKDNKLTNGNYNIKGGSVTFMDGTFTGTVTRETSSSLGWDNYGDGTVNIGYFGYGTTIKRAISNQYSGDKRVTVLEDAEVELYNLNKQGDKAYNNCIANFSTITVDGSLKLHSSYTPIRTIISETHSDDKSKSEDYWYKESVAHTYNGYANINVNEGATFIVEARELNGSFGALYTYNTNINVYRPAEFDLADRSTNTSSPVFHSGNKISVTKNSSLNIYDSDMAIWNLGKGTGTPNAIWENVELFEHVGFSSHWGNNRGTTKAIPDTNSLGKFTMLDYSRVRSEADTPQIIPDPSFKNKGSYEFTNGKPIYYGTTCFRKLDEFGQIVPVQDGLVTLRNNHDHSIQYTTRTNAKGEWLLDLSNEPSPPKVGEYSLYVNDGNRGENLRSKRVPTTIKDDIPPTAKTKLYMIEKGDDDALQNARKDSILWAEDETTPSEELIIDYFGLSEADKSHIINTPGMHENIYVEITDEAGNSTKLLAPVLVYEGQKPINGFVTGNDFEIDKHLFKNATEAEKRAMIIDSKYGNAKGYEIIDQQRYNVTNDPNKFIITVGELEQINEDVERYPITLKVAEYEKTIYAIAISNGIEVRIHQIKKGSDLKDPKYIYDDLEQKHVAEPVDTYINNNQSGGGINISDFLNDLDFQQRIKLEQSGYTRVSVDTYQWIVKDQVGSGETIPMFDCHIFVEYEPKNTFASVPDLRYGEIKSTSNNQKTHELLTGSAAGSNKVTVFNTEEKDKWSLNLALLDNEIKNEDKEGDLFLGGLVYYKQGQEIAITGNALTLESYEKSPSDEVDLIKDINLHSSKEDEGIRLKQRMGNSVGHYKGTLVWTLSDTPK